MNAWVLAWTAAAYVLVLVGVRIAGRRTIAELSAFDAVVTIALGSILASIATGTTAVGDGALALSMLLGLQVGLGWLRRRWPASRRLLDFPPERVAVDGRLDLPVGPLTSQLTADELRSRLRAAGYDDIPDGIVLLEPGGAVSVVRGSPGADADER